MSDVGLPDPPFSGETEISIRERMLDAVDTTFNKAEGDIVYDMLTPTAMELEQVYDSLEESLRQSFVQTAEADFLDLLGVQLTGLTRLNGETDTAYRRRLLIRLSAPRGAGNIADYKTWALEAMPAGSFVGVEPLWAGDGTVRVLLADDARAAATADQISTVAAYLATKAPVGAVVTVAAITIATVPMAITVVLAPGFANTTIFQAELTAALQEYIDTLAPGDDVIRAELIAAAMDVDGVFDVTALTINGVAANYVVAGNVLVAVSPITITV